MLLRTVVRRRPRGAPTPSVARFYSKPAGPQAGSSSADAGGGGDDPDAASLRTQLLEAALLEVPAKGWSVEALGAGAEACGLSPMAHGLCARGPVELVEFFSRRCDDALSAEVAGPMREEFDGLEVQNRLLLAMQTRLRMLEEYVKVWPQALALRALPHNLPTALADAHSLAGVLLDACGESAQAPLFPLPLDAHMKHLSVGAVYGAGELYMLTDGSPGFSDTMGFLEREVAALHTLADCKGSIADLAPLLGGGAGALLGMLGSMPQGLGGRRKTGGW